MSISIYAFCRKERISKHNTVTVYLRLTSNQKSRYVSTGIKVPISEWDFNSQRLKTDNKGLQYQILEHIERYNNRIKRLAALGIDATLDNIIDESHTINCTVSDYFDRVIQQLESADKFGTASKYKATKSLLNQFNMGNVRFSDISLKYLENFELALLRKGNKTNSIATKFSVLKAIYNRALSEKIFICKDNPFEKYKVHKLWASTRKRAIRKEDILRLIDASIPETNSPYTDIARDIFLFSYFSAGINFKDIAMLRYSDVVNDRVYYRRHKTGKEITFGLLPQSKMILAKYSCQNKKSNDYIFPILDNRIHKTTLQINDRVHKVLGHINRELKKWSNHIGLNIPLTTYVARHTYATVLKRSGVNIALISESLGHSSLTTTQIYLDSFGNSEIDKAMRNLV